MNDGTLKIILHSALSRNFKGKTEQHDLTVEVDYYLGKWKPDAVAYAYSYNSKLNNPKINWIKSKSTKKLCFSVGFELEPDLWVPGGKIQALVQLSRKTNEKYEGTYKGSFKNIKIAGLASANFAKKKCQTGKISSKRPEILRIFDRSGASSQLYDFSFAGISDQSDKKSLPIFNIEDFGIKANSGKEARNAVQKAVDAAAEAGGGIICFPPGEFDFSVKEKQAPVFIQNSNIILRGAGSGADGTILCNHRASDSPDPSRIWLAGLSPGFFMIAPNAKKNFMKTETKNYTTICEVIEAKRGAQIIKIKPPEKPLISEKTYLLRYLENTEGDLINSLISGVCKPAKNYCGEGKALVTQLFEIEDIRSEEIIIDSPVHWDLGKNIYAEICSLETISGIVIENFRLRSDWRKVFVHHDSPEHDNGWDHIKLSFARNCVIRNITHDSCTSAVTLNSCKNCLVEDNRIYGNPGHNGFICNGASTNNLFNRCYANRQMHGLSISETVCGNVFLDCEINEGGGIDLHGGVCLDNLFDRITGGVNSGGGSQNAVPPRHSHGLVFWNWLAGFFNPYNTTKFYDLLLRFDETPGFICAGARSKYSCELHFMTEKGKIFKPNKTKLSWIEFPGRKVSPDSLYIYQKYLKRR